MFLYQLTLVVAENKFDEFIESLKLLSSGIKKEQGCLDFSLYRDLEKKDAYRVLGEWQMSHVFQAFMPDTPESKMALGKVDAFLKQHLGKLRGKVAAGGNRIGGLSSR